MWKKIKGQMGSNPGGLYEDESGIRWYVKFLSSKDRMMNELLANKLYELAGAHVPESKLVNIDGEEGLASKYNPSLSQGYAEKLTGGREGFAIDAWLANWDVVGLDYDNMLIDEENKVHRIDPGGALDYRAQGGRKGPAFGDEVSELDTLRNPDMNETAHSVFGDMSNAEIRQSIDKVLAIPDNEIKRVVMKYGPSNKQELLKKLLARKKYLKNIKPKFASRLLNKQAFVKLSFVSKCPGHRNSKGELAEWCVKSHDTGEIISSHKTKAQAKEHLKQMHIHKGSIKRAKEVGVKVPAKLLNALEKLDRSFKPGKGLGFFIEELEELSGLTIDRINSGSSRAVFAINDNVVLKIATSKTGIDQNKVEYKTYEKVETCSMITRIFYYNTDFKWLISERTIRQVKDSDFGVYGADSLNLLVAAAERPKDADRLIDTKKDPKSLKDLQDLISKFGLLAGDLLPNNWGIVERKGQEYPVVLDYGLDQAVWYKHYN